MEATSDIRYHRDNAPNFSNVCEGPGRLHCEYGDLWQGQILRN